MKQKIKKNSLFSYFAHFVRCTYLFFKVTIGRGYSKFGFKKSHKTNCVSAKKIEQRLITEYKKGRGRLKKWILTSPHLGT